MTTTEEPTAAGELAASLLDALAPETDPPPEYEEGEAADALDAWHPTGLESATWAARKLAVARARRAEVERYAADERARLDAWVERQSSRADRDAEFFENRLRHYHELRLAEDPKKNKTVPLPDGTELRSLAGKLAVEVEDLDALIRWAEENELAEEILDYPEPAPKKQNLATKFGAKAKQETEPGDYPAVSEEGEVVPGVKIVRKARTYTVSSPDA